MEKFSSTLFEIRCVVNPTVDPEKVAKKAASFRSDIESLVDGYVAKGHESELLLFIDPDRVLVFHEPMMVYQQFQRCSYSSCNLGATLAEAETATPGFRILLKLEAEVYREAMRKVVDELIDGFGERIQTIALETPGTFKPAVKSANLSDYNGMYRITF